MDLQLRDKTVVVTGGTGALGRAVVERLLGEGARPVVTWRSEREVREFPAASRVRLNRLDLADEAAVVNFYRDLPDLWASVHLAGAFAAAPVTETSAPAFLGMLNTNATSCFLCCREAVRVIRSTGNGAGGRVVNVSARPALAPAGGVIAYAASKAAVSSITQCLAEEVKGEGILVNAVAPSLMDTPANRAAMPGADFSKWPKVEEVAETIAFLASPANALTSGAVVPVYGRV